MLRNLSRFVCLVLSGCCFLAAVTLTAARFDHPTDVAADSGGNFFQLTASNGVNTSITTVSLTAVRAAPARRRAAHH